MRTLKTRQTLNAALVAGLLLGGLVYGYLNLGWLLLLVAGIPGLVTFVLWFRTYLHTPADPAVLLPPFLVTVAGFELHLIEEYLGHYGPAMSRLFNLGFTQDQFVLVAIGLSAALSLIALGLYRRVPLAGFAALLFLLTRFSEFSMFVFPLLRPALKPENMGAISERVASGAFVEGMPSYYAPLVERYYFPGMYTVALTILPALYALYRFLRKRSTATLEQAGSRATMHETRSS